MEEKKVSDTLKQMRLLVKAEVVKVAINVSEIANGVWGCCCY